MSITAPTQARVASLDQFRGYTVVGMFFVNFVGSFLAIPAIFHHHHTYCSYADTIMPQFFFAVGFAYRLTLLRRLSTGSALAAYVRVFRRSLGLVLVALVVYHLSGRYETWQSLRELDLPTFLGLWKRQPFQTLLHIAVTQIWVLPVIAARPSVRIIFAIASGLLHLYLSYLFNYEWSWAIHRYDGTPRGVDGGPLAFLTWTIPMLAGSLAYDAVMPDPRAARCGKIFFWGFVVMLLAYAISCLSLVEALVIPRLSLPPSSWSPPTPSSGGPDEFIPEPGAEPAAEEKSTLAALWDRAEEHLVEPPFVPPTRQVNIWSMSQRAGSLAYLTFGAGFSLFLYAFFVMVCDLDSRRARLFGNVAMSAMAAFLMLEMVVNLVLELAELAGRPFVAANSPLWSPVVWLVLFLVLFALDPWRSAFFRTFGVNALVGYILHDMVGDLIKPFSPKDSPLWYVSLAFLVFLAINYLFLRSLEKNKIFVRL